MRALVQDAVALARTHWKDEGGGTAASRSPRISRPSRGCGATRRRSRDAMGHLVRNALDAMPGGGQTGGGEAAAATGRCRARGGRHGRGRRGGGQAANVRSVLHDARAGPDGARAHHGPERDQPAAAAASTSPRARAAAATAVSVWLPAASGAAPAPGRGQPRTRPARRGPGRRPPDRNRRGIPSAGAVPRRRGRARPSSSSRTRSRCARCSCRP